MFKKLKDKITEEVKISPQRIQQFTQSVTDKLQNTTNEDSFFSITEDEPTTISDSTFTNVSLHATPTDSRIRRNSNSSILSDVSFLPRYEPSANNYHIQSDMDASASEFEDNASTSSQLGNVTKEQVHLAFQKAQMRYHKYRGRYTDLSKHYKELERDNVKMKSVLVETQDKAIRRVSELKEQCTLSQKAKADLEHALRTEIEEKQFVINTLKHKIDLIQEQTPIPSNEQQIGELNEKINELKADAIILQAESKEKIVILENNLEMLKNQLDDYEEREKLFATSKKDLHAELLDKDTEIANLRRDYDLCKDTAQLKAQNGKLIDKCESLSAKCQQHELEMIKLEQYQLEIAELQSERIKFKKQLDDVRYDCETMKSKEIKQMQDEARNQLFDLEQKIRKELDRDYQQREFDIANEYERKLIEIGTNHADSKELHIKFLKCEDDLKIAKDLLTNLTKELDKRKIGYNTLESKYLELIDENNERVRAMNDFETKLKSNNLLIDKMTVDLDAKTNEMRQAESCIRELSELDVRKGASHSEELNNMRKQLNALKAQYENDVKLSNEQLQIIQNEKTNFELDLTKKYNNELEDCRLLIEQLKNDNENLKSNVCNSEELNAKQNTIDDLNDTIKKYEIDLKLVQKQVNQFDVANKQLVSDNDILKNQLIDIQESKTNELLKCQEITNELQKSIDEMNKTIDKYKNDLELTEKQVKQFDLQNQELKNGNEMLKNQLSDLRIEQTNALETVNNLHKTIDIYENDLKLTKKQFDLDNKQMKEENELLRNKLNDLQIEKTNELQEGAEKINDLHKYKEKANELQETINDLHKTIDKYENDFKLTKKQFDLDNKQMKNDNELLTNQLNDLQIEKTNVLEKLTETINQLHEYREKTNELEETINNLHKTIDKDSNELKAARIDLNTLKMLNEKLENEKEALINSCKKEGHKKLEELQRIIDDMNMKMEKYVIEIQTYEERVKELEKLKKIDDKFDEEKNILQSKIVELNSQLQSMNTLNNKIEKDLRNKFDEQMKHELKILNTNLDEKDNLIETLGNNLKKIKNDLEEAEMLKDIEINKSKINDDLIMRLKDDLRKTVNELENKAQDCIELESNLAKNSLQVDELREEIKQLRNERIENDGKINELTNQINALNEMNYLEQIQVFEGRIKSFEEKEKNYKLILDENDNLKAEMLQLQALQDENQRKDLLIDELEEFRSVQHLNILDECEMKRKTIADEVTTMATLNAQLTTDNQNLIDENVKLQSKIDDFMQKFNDDDLHMKIVNLNKKYETTLDENQQMKYELTTVREELHNLISHKRQLEGELNALEKNFNDLINERQLLKDEIDEFKISPLNLNEMDCLKRKLDDYKSIDATNRSSIEFYENELEKMRLKNEKLNRKLDETLVTLKHCADLSAESTQVEYLRSVLYNYMLGKESITMARVIVAVCKFDRHQSDEIMKHEQHKQTLLGQLGIL